MGIETALIAGGASLIGSSMAGKSAERAANTSAQAQLDAAKIAAQEARFRPIGMTTRFGRSTFGFELPGETAPVQGPDESPADFAARQADYQNRLRTQGVLTSAGYETTPELKALQDRLAALYGQSLTTAEGATAATAPMRAGAEKLFGLAGEYLATSPEAARQQYINEQMAILDPIRRREEEALQRSAFARGRTGLSVGARGQPELATLAEARRAQDLQLAAGADRAARERIAFGQGLFQPATSLLETAYGLPTKALAPFLQQFGAEQLLEETGRQPFDLSLALGARQQPGQSAAAQALLSGGTSAAQTQLQGRMIGPTAMLSSVGSFSDAYLRQKQNEQLWNNIMSSRAGMPSGVNLYGSGVTNPFEANWWTGEI